MAIDRQAGHQNVACGRSRIVDCFFFCAHVEFNGSRFNGAASFVLKQRTLATMRIVMATSYSVRRFTVLRWFNSAFALAHRGPSARATERAQPAVRACTIHTITSAELTVASFALLACLLALCVGHCRAFSACFGANWPGDGDVTFRIAPRQSQLNAKHNTNDEDTDKQI